MKMDSKLHYNEYYYKRYKKGGEFGGIANKFKFNGLITKGMSVLDFGCGAGSLLAQFNGIVKYGVEINPIAREQALKNGINCHATVKTLPLNYFDLIISHHALEHVEDPLGELRSLYECLKTGSKICIVVPCDTKFYKYKPNDINQHLFSWSPMNLGNIITCAGFEVIESYSITHVWPPFKEKIVKFFGWKLFHFTCHLYGYLEKRWSQTKVIAHKI